MQNDAKLNREEAKLIIIRIRESEIREMKSRKEEGEETGG